MENGISSDYLLWALVEWCEDCDIEVFFTSILKQNQIRFESLQEKQETWLPTIADIVESSIK